MRRAILLMTITWKVIAQTNPVVEQVLAAAQMRDYVTAERLVHTLEAASGLTPT